MTDKNHSELSGEYIPLVPPFVDIERSTRTARGVLGVIDAADSAYEGSKLRDQEIDTLRAGIEAAESRALIDERTGLLNEVGFRKFVEEWVYKEGASGHTRVVFVAIDINGLKLVNDTKGRKAGNKLLESVAKTIKKIATSDLRKDDVVGIARLGDKADEFYIMLPAREVQDDYSDHVEADVPELLRQKINALLAEKNKNKQFAVGISYSTREELQKPGAVDEAMEIAEVNMKGIKGRMKAGINSERYDI